MFKNYFKTAWRNLWKNKFFSAINIIGLAVGIAACIVILLFVSYERSFDNMHTKNIYRLNEVQKFEGMAASQKVGLSMFPMGPTLKSEFPEILQYTRIRWSDKYQMTYGERRIFFPSIHFVDSAYFKIFDFKLLRGNRQTALEKPHSIVLTEEGAQSLFGKEDPMGKTVTHYGNDTTSFVVTGILENVPKNSQLQFSGLCSFNTIYKPDFMNNWGGNWLDTYFELAPHTDAKALEKKFPAYLKKYMARNDGWKSYELFLLPLREVHAGASDIGLDYLNFQKFDKNYTRIFFIIALIVLVIACVNFMNLSTARSADRAKEVGIRKSIGAHRFQLGLQFIVETLLLSLIALFIALILVELALPYVNHLSQRSLRLPIFSDLPFLLAVLSGTVLVGLLSGLYPAAYLSSFQPIKVLKGSVQTGRDKATLRNILVVSQFTSAIFLMIATIFVVRQLNFMRQKDPGFNRDQMLTVSMDGITSKKYDLFKQSLLSNSAIAGVTASRDQLGSHLDQTGIQFQGDGPLRQLASTILVVDPDYMKLYKIGLAEGKPFSSEKSASGKEYIINEALAKELLKDNPKATMTWLLGRNFGFDSVGRIVGIAKNFNFNSLHYKIETMFLVNIQDFPFRQVSVKLKGRNVPEALASVQATWKKLFPDNPFEYQFLDEHFEDVYRADTQVSRIVGILAGLAILISCLGLFGLASHSAEKRVKEVGVRKVLGASVQSIVSLLSIHFLKLVLISNLIAWPIVWYALHVWLQDYAYHIEISWWVFVLAGLTALVIALATVSYQAIRAARANPVKSLRSE